MKYKKLSRVESFKMKLEAHEICNIVHKLSFNDDFVCWCNPSNQFCFNSGTYHISDLEQWLEGEGCVIKGDTQDEKDKFFELAIFNHKYPYSNSFTYSYKHFNKIKFRTEDKVNLPVNDNTFEARIAEVGGFVINMYESDFIDLEVLDELLYLRNEVKRTTINMLLTFKHLGYGEFGAINKPENIKNFSWFAELVFHKLYYNHLNKISKMPDYEFLSKFVT